MLGFIIEIQVITIVVNVTVINVTVIIPVVLATIVVSLILILLFIFLFATFPPLLLSKPLEHINERIPPISSFHSFHSFHPLILIIHIITPPTTVVIITPPTTSPPFPITLTTPLLDDMFIRDYHLGLYVLHLVEDGFLLLRVERVGGGGLVRGVGVVLVVMLVVMLVVRGGG